MSLTYAAQQSGSRIGKSGTVAIVVLLHVGFFYAFTHGLNVVKIVAPLKETVAVFIAEQTPPPPRLPVPDIKPMQSPIETMVPEVPAPIDMEIPPEVPVNVDTGASAITTGTAVSDAVPARSFAIIHRVDPVYPAASRRSGESGTVLLNIVVGPAGVPAEVSVERGSGFMALDDAAVAAVRKWRFKVSGDTDYSMLRLPVTFRLDTGR